MTQWCFKQCRSRKLHIGACLQCDVASLTCDSFACAAETPRQGLGIHSASTSSLQYTHEEGLNGAGGFARHPAHIRTGSVADSADDTAQASGAMTAHLLAWQHRAVLGVGVEPPS